jgi:hypothetical protein|tara:strand:+ start:39 stop:374 length:336 start_codon:yes stop_codon:yes gene_type:complete
MAVINIYKFASLNANTDNTEKNPFGTGNPPVNETYLIKSILVKSAGTPTPTVTNDGSVVIQPAALTANESKELLTQPLIVEGGKTLTIKAGSADAFTFGVSYLNIKKEVTT